MTFRGALALVAVVGLAGCSAIPPGGDAAADLRARPRPEGARLGRLAVAPVTTCDLTAGELAKGWRAREAFDTAEVRDDLARALEATGSFDLVRPCESLDLSEAWRDQDDFVATVAIENARTTFVGHNGWWIPNMVNFVFWVWPAWLVATEEYALAFDAHVLVTSGDSGALVLDRRVPVEVSGTFDEWDRGWQLLGPIAPSNDADNWRRIATLLLPAARRQAALEAAGAIESSLRAAAGSDELRRARRKSLALAIGVSRYADSNRLPALPFAAEDARSVARAIGERGVPADHVVALADAEATVAAVQSAVAQHLSRAREGDSVVVFFSGYGTRAADGTPVLLLHDANGDAGSLSLDALGAMLAQVRGEKLLVIDAAFDGRGRSVGGGRPTARSDMAGLEAVPGLCALLAAQADEAALAGEHGEHGLVTEHLLEALSGAADQDHDGRLTGAEIYAFVRPRVVFDAAILGAKQSPRATGLDRPFALADERRAEKKRAP